MSDDIVARLRELDADLTKEIENGEHGKEGEHWVIPFDCLCEAADEIERLRAVVEAWLKYSQRAEREIERLRAERDEARREVCSMNETGLRMNESDKKREAKRRGWDCFKENTDDR